MLSNKPSSKTLRKLLSLYHQPPKSLYSYTQISNYVNVYMKWKKDSYFDTIDHIHKSQILKPIIALKNCISQDPNGCIPISLVSKSAYQLDVPMKVANFLRKYPSVFEEFTGPKYNHPWFRLTQEAAEIDRDENMVYEECREELKCRLKKLVLMSKDKVLPLKIVQGMQWYLGLPCDFLDYPDRNLDGSFRFVVMEDGLKGLAVECSSSSSEEVLSMMQKNAMKKGVYSGGNPMEPIEFPLFASKGLRLRTKIKDWLKEFQQLPYVSPYGDFLHLQTDSDESEKRVVGLFHELLSLFVENAAERKKLRCLNKYMCLPQKVHRMFERHPEMFYLSHKNKTCTVILKEAYCDESAIEKHPVLEVRKKYIRLMRKSAVILKNRRVNGWLAGRKLNCQIEDEGSMDLDSENQENEEECPHSVNGFPMVHVSNIVNE